MSGSGTGSAVSGVASAGGLVTPPTFEPITLAELKLHLRIDSGSFSDNIDETQGIAPGSYGIDYELLTLDVAPGGTGFAAGDTLTGQTSTKTCVVVTVITPKTYIVKSKSGAFTLGEIISNGTNTADQGAAYPTFIGSGYYILGAAVEVLGYTAVVILASGTNAATGTLDVKVQDSDDNSTWTDWTGGTFTQVTTSNDNAIYEKAYTGAKRYIRTVAKVLLAACEFSTLVIRLTATAIEDDWFNDAIAEARQYVEDITHRKIITQTWDYCLDAWPLKNFIELPFGNLQTVSSIIWKDNNGAETILTLTTDYLVETNGEKCGRVVLPYGGAWPSGTLYPSNPITIRFVCGWTTAALVSRNLKAMIKLYCTYKYKHRGEAFVGQIVSEDNAFDRLRWLEKLWDVI